MFGDFPLGGKIVIVTGGASGIGLAFVQTALAANAKVIVADLAQTDAIKSLGRNNPNVRFKQCDVGKWADLESLIAFSESEFGDVPDVFAANAGIMESEQTGFWGDEEHEAYALLNINLGHPIKLTRIAIRTFVKHQKRGVVLVTSSIAGTNGHLGTPLYVASKHGTLGFVKSLAKMEDLADIKVVAICPGLVETPLLLRILEQQHQEQSEKVLLKTAEIATRMMEVIESGAYAGGMALTVSRPGDATIFADGLRSELENLVPTSMEMMLDVLAKDKAHTRSL